MRAIGRHPAPADDRLFRPLLRLVEFDGLPALVVDPDACATADADLEPIVAAFVRSAREAHRARVVAEAATVPRGQLTRLARARDVDPSTLRRWMDEQGRRRVLIRAKSVENARLDPPERADDGPSGAGRWSSSSSRAAAR